MTSSIAAPRVNGHRAPAAGLVPATTRIARAPTLARSKHHFLIKSKGSAEWTLPSLSQYYMSTYCGLLGLVLLLAPLSLSAFFAPLQVSESESTFSTVNCFSEPLLLDISEVLEADDAAPLAQSP